MTAFCRTFIIMIAFYALMAVSFVAHAQLSCVQLGTIVDCGSLYGSSQTQVQLSPNTGVIITDQTTVPYTILTQPQPYKGFDPAPLPSATPNYSHQPSTTPSPFPIFPPSSGLYGEIMK